MFRHVRDYSGCYGENRLLGGKSGNKKVGGYCERVRVSDLDSSGGSGRR